MDKWEKCLCFPFMMTHLISSYENQKWRRKKKDMEQKQKTKKKKKGKGLYVSREKFSRFILLIVAVIIVLLVSNIMQVQKNSKLEAANKRISKQVSSVQEDKNELEKTLKEKEAEIESLKNDLTVEEELKTNVNLVKSLRYNNENLQKKISELEAKLGIDSSSSSSASSATTAATTAATTTATTAATEATTAVINLIGDKATKYYHKQECQYVSAIKPDNELTQTKEQFDAEGYKACTYCNP